MLKPRLEPNDDYWRTRTVCPISLDTNDLPQRSVPRLTCRNPIRVLRFSGPRTQQGCPVPIFNRALCFAYKIGDGVHSIVRNHRACIVASTWELRLLKGPCRDSDLKHSAVSRPIVVHVDNVMYSITRGLLDLRPCNVPLCPGTAEEVTRAFRVSP